MNHLATFPDVMNIFERDNRLFYTDHKAQTFGEIVNQGKVVLHPAFVEQFVIAEQDIYALSGNKIVKIKSANSFETVYTPKKHITVSLNSSLVDGAPALYLTKRGEYMPSTMLVPKEGAWVEQPVFYHQYKNDKYHFTIFGSKIAAFEGPGRPTFDLLLKNLIPSLGENVNIHDQQIILKNDAIYLALDNGMVVAFAIESKSIKWIWRHNVNCHISEIGNQLLCTDHRSYFKIDKENGTLIKSIEQIPTEVSHFTAILMKPFMNHNLMIDTFHNYSCILDENLDQWYVEKLNYSVPNDSNSIYWDKKDNSIFILDIEHKLHQYQPELGHRNKSASQSRYTVFATEEIVSTETIGTNSFEERSRRYIAFRNEIAFYFVLDASVNFEKQLEIAEKEYEMTRKTFTVGDVEKQEDKIIFRQHFWGNATRDFRILASGDLYNDEIIFKKSNPK